jgi:cyanophycinase
MKTAFFLLLIVLLLPTTLVPILHMSTLSGRFVLVGGGDIPKDIKEEFVKLTRDGPIVVIPTAAEHPETLHFDFPRYVTLHATSRQQCYDPSFYNPLTSATGVWISGGDQLRLVSMYRNTPLAGHLQSVLRRGGVIGGTSAGASAVSRIMPYESRAEIGFGLIDGYIVDQHFNNRHRLPRLLTLLSEYRNNVGIGIDESTAIVIDDSQISVLGNGYATICEKGKVTKFKSGDIIHK